MKIAIIDKNPSGMKYGNYFDFPHQVYHLSSVKVPKLLKKDVDLELNPDDFDYLILVGSEATKHFLKKASVVDHSGYLMEGKFIPLINPAITAFKPEVKPLLTRSVEQINRIIAGENLVDTSGDFRGILDTEEALQYLDLVNTYALESGIIALDTETTALYPRDGYVLGISISGKERTGAYIHADIITEEVVDKLQELVTKYKVIFHNSKFDMKMLQYHFNLKFFEFEDTLLLHYLLDETQGSHGLKQLAIKYTKYGDYDKALTDFKEEYCRKYKLPVEQFTYDLIPFSILSTYAAIDTAVTLELYNFFYPLVEKNPKLLNVNRKLLVPGIRMLTSMEEYGIPFDPNRLLFAQETIDKSILEAREKVLNFEEVKDLSRAQSAEFNPNSVQQLRTLLFDMLHLTPLEKKTGTGLQSTDSEVLEELKDQHPIVEAIISLRQLGKIKGTYVDKILLELDRDSRLRTGFSLTSTTSGRLSSSGKFNAQQIPRNEKRVKGSIKGYGKYENWSIVSQDLATAEMYYAAVLSGDPKLQKVFVEGGDFHSAIAKSVFKLNCNVEDVKLQYSDLRQAAKAIN